MDVLGGLPVVLMLPSEQEPDLDIALETVLNAMVFKEIGCLGLVGWSQMNVHPRRFVEWELLNVNIAKIVFGQVT